MLVVGLGVIVWGVEVNVELGLRGEEVDVEWYGGLRQSDDLLVINIKIVKRLFCDGARVISMNLRLLVFNTLMLLLLVLIILPLISIDLFSSL